MKKVLTTVAILLLLTIIAWKKEGNQTMTVIKDCTGTYLRLDGKDYRVCNIDKTSSFTEGTKVTATYKKIKNCIGLAKDVIVCKMLHANEGWIEVEKIK